MALHYTPGKPRAAQIRELEEEWRTNPRWKDVKRGYSAEHVVNLRGTIPHRGMLAAHGADKLWEYLHTEDYINCLGAVTGALEPGLAADFLVLEMESPEVLPSWDFSWELVRYYDRANIVATVVGGRPAVVGGEPVGVSLDAFTREHLEIGIRSIDDADIVRLHGPSDSHRP